MGSTQKKRYRDLKYGMVSFHGLMSERTIPIIHGKRQEFPGIWSLLTV